MTPEFKRGAKAAAAIAQSYRTTHDYRLDDCILGKLNIGRAKPRKNKAQIMAPTTAETLGFIAALAQVAAQSVDRQAVRLVARDAGITLELARKLKVFPGDIRMLKRAGVR